MASPLPDRESRDADEAEEIPTNPSRRITMASNNNQQGGNKGNNQSGDTSNRGFASMDPQKQREIAPEGGKAAHASGNAHEFNSEEARRAGSQSHKNDCNSQNQG